MKWSSLTEEEQNYIVDTIENIIFLYVTNVNEYNIYTVNTELDNTLDIVLSPCHLSQDQKIEMQKQLDLLYLGFVRYKDTASRTIFTITLYDKNYLQYKLDQIQQQHKLEEEKYMNALNHAMLPLCLTGHVCK